MDGLSTPTHYSQGPVHCIDAMMSAFHKDCVIDFCRLNAFKYIWRSDLHKDGRESNMRKAIWYLNKAVQLEQVKCGHLKNDS